MNREHKYRAWDKVNKVIREVWNICWDFTPASPTMILALNPVINSEYALREGQFELIEYTGLKDKNGKDIYEGDVLRLFDNQEYISAVSWNDENAEFQTKGFTNREWRQAEIIGNIYEHPTLINK